MVRVTVGNLVNNLTGSSPDGQAEVYFGTVTVNGATAVGVPQPLYTAGDVVQFGLLTAGGTVSTGQPNVAAVTSGTAGVIGFQVKATASDTSVYNYIGFKPAAQQNV